MGLPLSATSFSGRGSCNSVVSVSSSRFWIQPFAVSTDCVAVGSSSHLHLLGLVVKLISSLESPNTIIIDGKGAAFV